MASRPLGVVCVSGGMDSCVTAAIAAKERRLAFLHANYGQRTEKKELECFHRLADHYGAEARLVDGALRSAHDHGLQHEVLSAREMRDRYPMLQLEPAMVAVWEPRAGVLSPEACVKAQLEQARAQGATLCVEQPVERWQAESAGVRLVTARGTYRARQLVISAGAWVAQLLPDMATLHGVAVGRHAAYMNNNRGSLLSRRTFVGAAGAAAFAAALPPVSFAAEADSPLQIWFIRHAESEIFLQRKG